MYINNKDMYTFLVESGLVSRTDLVRAQEKSAKTGHDIGRILVHDGLLDERDMRKMYGKLLGIAFVDLSDRPISFETITLIPEPMSRRHNVVAFNEEEDTVSVALLDLESLYLVKQLLPRRKISPYFTDEQSLTRVLRTYQSYLEQSFGKTIQKEIGFLHSFMGAGSAVHEDPTALLKQPSLSYLIEALIKHAYTSHASDIHIEPRGGELLVRYRIHGALYDAMALPVSLMKGLSQKLKSLAGADVLEQSAGGVFGMRYEGEEITCRMTTIPTIAGEKVVIKLVKKPSLGFSLEGLGMSLSDADHVYEQLKKHTGMVYVAGEAHSGVTTCLYTLLDTLNDGHVSIGTVESPVEYELGGGIMQTQVSGKERSYAEHITAFLKQDTDIIMVGNVMKDVFPHMVHGARMGSYMLGGVHYKSVVHMLHDLPQTLSEENDIHECTLLIGTRLLRTLSQDKESYTLNAKEIADLKKKADLDKVLMYLVADHVVEEGTEWNAIQFYKQKGATAHKGYSGVYEVLPLTKTLRDAAGTKTLRELEKMVYADAMTFLEAGIYKAVQGVVSLEEVLGSEV